MTSDRIAPPSPRLGVSSVGYPDPALEALPSVMALQALVPALHKVSPANDTNGRLSRPAGANRRCSSFTRTRSPRPIIADRKTRRHSIGAKPSYTICSLDSNPCSPSRLKFVDCSEPCRRSARN